MSMQAKNKWEWMVEEGKECDSHPFTSPQKMDGIPQFPSKICGVVDGYRPFEDGYPSLAMGLPFVLVLFPSSSFPLFLRSQEGRKEREKGRK